MVGEAGGVGGRGGRPGSIGVDGGPGGDDGGTGGDGDGGGGGYSMSHRGPQSWQSVPYKQCAYSAPLPPSSQSPSEAKAGAPVQASEQEHVAAGFVGGLGGFTGGTGGTGGDAGHGGGGGMLGGDGGGMGARVWHRALFAMQSQLP